MGFMFLMCQCANCKAIINVNPSCCPSLTVNGSREAICKSCFDKWNKIHRTDKGLEPVPLNPQAYEPEEVQ